MLGKNFSNVDFIEVLSIQLLHNQEDQIKAISSNYLLETLGNLEEKAAGNFTPRIVIYSAHDTTIWMILNALKMTNLPCIVDYYLENKTSEDTCIYLYPKYTSNVIF